MNLANNSRIQQILKMLQDNPKDEFLSYALALEYVAHGEYKLAEKIFLDLIRQNPEYHASYYQLAKLYEILGEKENAEIYYVAGLEMTKKLGERHAYNELRSAYEEMLYE